MTPDAFVAKWAQTATKERAASQEHFIDLCRVLGEKTPHEADPTGEWFAFEKGVERTGAGRGWADVWKRGHFGWEYKSKSGGRTSTMAGALIQLQQYALALESPPLLIVSDIDTIEIHTAFQNAVQDVHVVTLAELIEPSKLDLIRSAFKDPERLRPKQTRNQVTAEAAGQFADLAFALRNDGHDPQIVAHFLNKILFCMFAEDVGILKTSLFTEIAEKGVVHPEHFNTFIQQLFGAMRTGGPFGTEIIDWFNGGLFDDNATLPLTLPQIRKVRDLSRMDWSQIEPAIFGTLFERGLDPDKRSQLGAHYTDPESIMRLVNPTIVEPLLAEWQGVRADIAAQMERMELAKTRALTKKRLQAANNTFQGFQEKLRNFRVLDPACGSGNFLYLSLQALKNIELRANIEAEALGLQKQNPLVGPESVLGIEINAYAAELARVTIWIGEIQWMLGHGYSLNKNPILKPLNNIENHDAILNPDDTEPTWPKADVIVGNPPFLGDKKMMRELGDEYVAKIRNLYAEGVPGGADLVIFWFEKARKQLANGGVNQVGLVSTNSIRGGKNRLILDRIVKDWPIYDAYSDEPWINEGAAVRVSTICFGQNTKDRVIRLNDRAVPFINSDLSSSVDLTQARCLMKNQNIAFIGNQKGGPFDIDGELARKWLISPNPNGRPNRDVLRPWANGSDVTRRPRGKWIIDFNDTTNESVAALYEAPFEYLRSNLQSKRTGNREARTAERWWLHQRARPAFRSSVETLDRFIITPRVAKHRIFVWAQTVTMPDSATVAIARNDDETFGVLHSRFHELWSLGLCTWLGVGNDPRYTPTTTFETFPFPDGLTPNLQPKDFSNPHASGVELSARELDGLRNEWLNPKEWVDVIPEVVSGYPDRLVAKKGHQSNLNKRTLTNLYNERPAWLENAHRKLDAAVAAAYGWPVNLSDDDVLAKLLELNKSRLVEDELDLH